ncbi:MAG: winged helix-turn-helix transcriptional regulator [Clostridia bacterium]|nr:winged helix-turn-helix transcriptional regulator [Clostridia bacterium]
MQERFKTFTVLIAKISRAIRRIKTEEMAEFDLKSPHVSCLYYLYKEKSLTAKELCDICDEDKAAVSRSIDFLETNGYIAAPDAAKKRYKTPLFLTEKGERIGAEIAKKIDDILAKASVGLSEENREIFYKSLTLISDNLQNICENYEGEKNG